MSQEFQREDRYIVIKRSDLQQAEHHALIAFHSANHNLRESMSKNGVPDRQFVVIESDWPGYEPAWAMIEARMSGATVPPACGEMESLPQRKTGYPSLSNHRSYNDGFNKACDEWTPHVTRLQAEIAALQQRSNVADQRVDELEAALKFYADKEHYHFDEPDKWDSVSGEAENLLWHEEDPAYIEDGSVARNALKVKQ